MASNSMSMLRAPDPDSGIKGNMGNFPFWPGGLEAPEEEEVAVETQLEVEDRTGMRFRVVM